MYALTGAFVCLAFVALAAFFFLPSGAPATGPGGGGPPAGFGFGPSPVEVVVALETLASEPVSLLGSVTPVRQAVVASEVEGVVAEVRVDEGDEISAGDVLARLDTTTVGLDLAAARANRAEAAARLVRFESEVRRISDLRGRGAISEREFEQAIADRDAQAQAVTRFDSEAARLDELIARAEIKAPFGGVVADVQAEIGQWTGRGGAVITLVDLSAVEVTVAVPERFVSQVEEARRQGLEAPVVFDALPGRYSGRIRAVMPQANAQTRTFPAIVVVDNPDGLIRGGMFARVLAQVGDPVPTVLVPKDALVLRSGRTFVFRVVAGAPGQPNGPSTGATDETAAAEEIEVTIGEGFGAWQVVRGGIAGGDRVVVRGNEGLQPGAPVIVAAVAEMEPPPAPSGDLPRGEAGDGR